MVHTRGQGARPEGFSEYQPPKRERKVAPRTPMAPLIVSRSSSSSSPFLAVDPSALTGAAITRAPARTRSLYRDASTQTDAELTCNCHLEPASAKRRREPDDGATQAASKRHKAITPEQPKFLFSKTRNRSLLTSAPSKLSSRHESPFFHRTLEPTSPESSPANTQERPISQERPTPQQLGTPAPAAAQGGIMGSVRKLFGYFTGSSTQGPAKNVVGQQPPPPSQQSSLIDQDQTQDGDTTARESLEFSEQGSPTPAPRITIYEPDSPARDFPLPDSRILTREYLKRRRTANTIGGREQLAAMADSTESRAADFNPTETPGTNKRKLTSVEGQIPGPKRGGFGIDDSYLDMENEVEGIGESSLTEAQPATPATRLLPQTPLRSAMRQTGTDFGTVGRSVKSVRINPVDSVKAVYGQYGRSGDYRGSTFADLESQSPDSSSSLPFEVQHIHSPTTIQNTRGNTFRLDPNIIDPNDDTWRPSLANPRPGHFRVPDSDEFEFEEEEDTLTLHQAAAQEEVPPQPSTPRMSHAELPPTSPFELSGFTGHTDSIMVNETQEFRLNKARSDAQKYKPARSSRLFMSEKARSRSSSPPGSETEFTESQIETGEMLTANYPGGQFQETPVRASTRPTVSRLAGREELDNTLIGQDGMTDYQREHQYDSWAENLLNGGNAPSPQTYVEAGIASSYVETLVQKTWTERDTRESIEFWDREFEEGLRTARQATAQGRQLLWVTDPEEILEFERNGY